MGPHGLHLTWFFSFDIQNKDSGSRGRAARMRTDHGSVETPAFMAVGTQATVKTLSPQDLRDVGTQIIVAQHVSSLFATEP